MLSIAELRVSHGRIRALDGMSLEIAPGELVAVVGANGAGKSTLLDAVSGLLPIDDGNIAFEGCDLTHAKPHRMVEAGIVQVPEGRRLFPYFTVQENLELGCWTARARAHRVESLARIYEHFPILRERRDQLATLLSGGEQQMCAIARALMARPKLLMLDEPTLGLAPKIVRQVFEIVARLNGEGMTILLVEQNVKQALSMASRAYVLEQGRIVLAGRGAELLGDERLKKAYLG